MTQKALEYLKWHINCQYIHFINKLEEVRKLLQELGVPPRQQADLCCYVIFAMPNVEKDEKWTAATNEWIRIHDILKFISNQHNIGYAKK